MSSIPQILILVSLAIGFSRAHGAECDNFTNRHAPVRDSLNALDAYVTAKLITAVGNANKRTGCSKKRLWSAIDDELGSTPFGQVERWAAKSAEVERIPNQTYMGIYDGIRLREFPLTYTTGITSSILLNGQVIGVDKLGHFMAEGLDYYRKVFEEGQSLEDAFRWGTSTEETYFGLGVSGVKSYGDLAANYDGYKFWGNLLSGSNPYIKCQGDRFELSRRFTWADFVTAAWDEGVNCSEFSPSVRKLIGEKLAVMGQTCPVMGREADCAALASMKRAEWIISPVCRRLAKASIDSGAAVIVHATDAGSQAERAAAGRTE